MKNLITPRLAGITAIAVGQLMLSTAAFAQTDTTASGSMGALGTGMGADSLTCSDLTAMDTASVPGALYFLAGYRQAMTDSGGMASGSTTATGAAGTTTSGSTDTTTSGAADTTTSGSTDTAASGSTDTTTSGSTDTTTSGSTDTTTSGSTDTTSNTAAGGQAGTVNGLYEISVADIMTACGSTPDSSVSDILDQQRMSSGSN